jgi:hypothetical protein
VLLEAFSMIDEEEIVFRACKALVGLFRDQIESGRRCVHSRIFNYVLHPEEEYVQCGRSRALKAGDKPHPEHVVPCKVLQDECFRLIEHGTLTDSEIATLLQRHWKIAKITKEEARRLDSEMKLKSSMPGNWRFEDGDTFARFEVANISIVPN